MSNNEHQEPLRFATPAEIAALKEKFKGRYAPKCPAPGQTSPPKPVPDPRVYRAARQVAAALFDPGDIIEIRLLPAGKSFWFRASELASRASGYVAENASGENIFFGANPRRTHGMRGDEAVPLARCIFADFENTTVDEVGKQLADKGLPAPTLTIKSGHGVHVYWRFRDPITDLPLWTSLQQDLAAHLGSDEVVCNPERVMRLPAFVNHKEPKAPCELVECEPNRLYALAELRKLIPPRPDAQGQRAAPVGQKLRKGERNSTLMSLAGSIRYRGMDADEIYAALSAVNRNRCDPALEDEEVRRIAESACRYAPADSVASAPIEPYQPFPVDVLPPVLATFVIEAAQALGCDPAYVALPLLVAVASAIGNSRAIRLKAQWYEPAVLWCGVVGESGSLKSPAYDLALRPVHERQRRLLREWQRQRNDYEDEHRKWRKLPKDERNAVQEPEPPPPCKHPLCSDITLEALAERLQVTWRGVLIGVDELMGWLGSFNKYNSGSGDVAQWLSMFRAGPLKIDRKTGDVRTIYVAHAFVCILGGIQPDILRRAFGPQYFDNGLAARLLLAMPPRRPKQWTEAEITPETEATMDRLFGRLYELKPKPGPDGGMPDTITLSAAAKVAWVKFFNEHNSEQTNLRGALAAAWSKLEAYAARFALIFHCVREAMAESGPLIEERDAQNAIVLTRWFCRETRRIYAMLGETEQHRHRRELIELVRAKGGRVSVRELMRSSRWFASVEDWEQALNELVEAGLGRWDHPKPGAAGGHPIKVFVLLETAADTHRHVDS